MKSPQKLRFLLVLAGLVSAFTLDAAAISGRVHAAANGQPLAGVTVTALRLEFPFGGLVGQSTVTNAQGEYAIAALSAGLYYVEADAIGTDLVRQLHPSAPCPPESCAAEIHDLGSMQFNLSAADQLSNIDFNLIQGGSLSGIVRRADNQVPEAGANLSLLPLNWTRETDGTGAYAYTRLPPGVWRLRAAGDGDLVSTLYPNVACEFAACADDNSAQTEVVVTAGGNLSAYDILMPVGARIAGTLTPLSLTANQDVYVRIRHDATGAVAQREVTTGANGGYLVEGLAAGSYQVAVWALPAPFRGQVYPDVPCATQCFEELSAGNAVPTTLGQTTAGIDFMLTPGARVSGLVTDASNAQPLAGVEVIAYQWTFGGFGFYANILASDISAADGSYELTGIRGGTTRIVTRNHLGYRDVRIGGQLCAPGGCLDGSGSEQTLDWGSETSAHFALLEGASIHGRVRSPNSGSGLSAVVEIFNEAGQWQGTVNPAVDGLYHSSGLPAGAYRVRALTYGLPSYGQVYGGMSCNGIPAEQCDVLTGSVLNLVEGAPIEVNFDIEPLFVDGFE